MKKIKKFLQVIRPFVRPFLIVFFIYSVAMLAIWRSGVSFADDRGRAVFGYAWTSDFNRYTSTAFGLIMNMNDRLLDISPWPQLIGIAILSISSVILTYIFCDKKIKYLPLVLTTFIGIFPLTLECWLYKFDTPCIAFSIFTSILPFLWWPKNQKRNSIFRFSVISIICVFLMWTTYQASSGIFPVLCIYMCTKDYIKDKKLSPIIKSLLISILTFIIPTLIFKFCLPEPTKSYRTNEILAFSELIPGAFSNFLATCSLIIGSLNIWQKIFTILAFIGGTILSIKKFKITSLVLLIALTLSIPLSMGAYLLLKNPPLTARSLTGIGLAFVPILILLTKDFKSFPEYILISPNLALLYSFIMFALALGNGLADQERWANYRNDDLVSALSELYPNHNEVASKNVFISGTIGYSIVMQHVASKYPATYSIITDQIVGLGNTAWSLAKIRYYYNRSQVFQETGDYEKFCNYNTGKIMKDTYYFTIRDKDNYICIDLKN